MRKSSVFLLSILISSISMAADKSKISGIIFEAVEIHSSTATFRVKNNNEFNGCKSVLFKVSEIGIDNAAIRLVQVFFDLHKEMTIEFDLKKNWVSSDACTINGNGLDYIKDNEIFVLH